VIYGDPGGEFDGAIPAMILTWLGHAKVQLLDGVGIEQWTKAGYDLSTEVHTLPPTTYAAKPIEDFVWSADDLAKNKEDPQVVFLDTRSGNDSDLPSAIVFGPEKLLNANTRTTITPEEGRMKLAERSVTSDKTVVICGDSASQVSLPVLVLKDLGFSKVSIYETESPSGDRPAPTAAVAHETPAQANQ
jgi:3-mercaptopyruvate sulfurtransferase SseA